MRNRYKYLIIIACILSDIFAFSFSAGLSDDIAQISGQIPLKSDVLQVLSLINVVSWILSAVFFKIYLFHRELVLEKLFEATWKVFAGQQVLLYSCILFFHLPAGLNVHLWQLSLLLLYLLLSRIVFALSVIKLKSKSPKIAILGLNPAGIKLASHFEGLKQPIHLFDKDEPSVYNNPDEFKASLINAINQSVKSGIKELYVVAEAGSLKDINLYFTLADVNCLRLRFIPDFSNISQQEFVTDILGGFQVISSRPEPLEDPYNRLKKRIFDIVTSLCVLFFVMSWVYPLLTIIIKLQSRGPVLFKQLRTGENNQQFWCYKFRSMYVNKDSELKQAQKEDSRITAIGRFIRRTSIDELPQFYNVLRGEMSVVGPRPHMLKHTYDYSQVIENFMVRHFVKPGITGMSQISGLRGETKEIMDMQNRVDSDIEYLKYWSLMKDLKICILTVVTALRGDQKAF